MKALWQAQWSKIETRYDALVLRERWLVAAAVLGGIVLISATQVIEPALKRAKLAERSLIDQRTLLATLQSQVAVLQSPNQNPDVAARAELADLKNQLAVLGGRLVAMENSLVPPQRMAGLLETLVGRGKGLRLLSLRTLPVAPVLDKPAAKIPSTLPPGDRAADVTQRTPPDSAAGLYKHGVEIRLEGSYLDLAEYLARLERSQVKLMWSQVSLSADKHPRLVLTLTVFTLSLDRTWLTV